MKRVNMDDTASCPGSIGRSDLATFEQSSDREWLVTNGLAGFAAGTVSSASDKSTQGRTFIAGYPWFGDWGRDTMIALPGLTLTTGCYDIAKRILLTFANHIDQGMLPDRFPDHGGKPEYNTVDATLWYVHAISDYTKASGNLHVARQIFAALTDIVDWHRCRTRYGIDEQHVLATGTQGGRTTAPAHS